MKRLLCGLLAGLREVFRPTWEHPDETDLEAEAAKRAAWVRLHRHQEEKP